MSRVSKSPGAAATASEAIGKLSPKESPQAVAKLSPFSQLKAAPPIDVIHGCGDAAKALLTIRVTFPNEPERPALVFTGRDAWAVQALSCAGSKGVTPIDTPGPRWSGYVFNLRRAGLNIETIHEKHGPPFAGTHARYVLHDRVQVERLEPVS